MQLFHYSRVSELLHPSSETLTLKTAYLLSDCAVTTQRFDLMIVMRREYSRRFDRDVRTRLAFLADHAKKADAQTAADIELAQKSYKRLSTMKNRGKREFAALKNAEQLISCLYKIAEDKECSGFELHGLHHLDNLPGGTGRCTYATPIAGDPETPLEGQVADSRILQLYGDDGNISDDDVTFVLQPEALVAPYKPARIYSPDDPEALEAGSIWMEELVSLPFFNELTNMELHSVRSDLSGPGAAFRGAFDVWFRGAKEGTMGIKERSLWYNEKVRPVMASLRDAVSAQPLLSALRKAGKDQDSIKVWVGEIPLRSVWDFYKQADTLAHTTAQVLASDSGLERGKLRVPAVFLSILDDNLLVIGEAAGKIEEATDALPVSVRKSIAAD